MGFLFFPIYLGFLIWAFFDPKLASYSAICFLVFLEGYLYFSQNVTKAEYQPNTEPYFFTLDEVIVLKRYSFYFNFPNVAKSFSSLLSFVQISTFIWVPWLLYNSLWIPAVIIGANYFLVGPLSVFFNPRFFLHDAVENKGKQEFHAEMVLIDSICDKLIHS